MKNPFVDYLNTLHNATASNDNALAESQAFNSFYDDIEIKRDITSLLGRKLKDTPNCIILSGHAGDGKTSIILQLLREYNLIQPDQGLKPYAEVTSVEFGRSLLYVKDMSELSQTDQTDLLRRAITSPKHGVSAIVVANTGPLIRSFKDLSTDTQASADEIEWAVLEALDHVEMRPIKVGDFEVYVINMARIDNVWLASSLLARIAEAVHWTKCTECEFFTACPIIKNVRDINANLERVQSQVTYFYRWLYELDRRLTVRQMLSQISFSFTGNLSCEKVGQSHKNYSLFDYHFSNLFSGYKGITALPDAQQIRGVIEIQELELDLKEFPIDYDMFVRNDFSVLHEAVQGLVEQVSRTQLSKYHSSDADQSSARLWRQAIRRFALFFGVYNEDGEQALLRALYSPVYPEYLKVRTKPMHTFQLKPLRTMVLTAIYVLFVGAEPPDAFSKIYLPLRRAGVDAQSVQLLTGYIDVQDITLEQKENDVGIEGESKFLELVMKFPEQKSGYPLSLLLLDYFYKLANGGISTKLKPALSHGLDIMKSELYEFYGSSKSDDMIQLLVNTRAGMKVVKLNVFDNKIYL